MKDCPQCGAIVDGLFCTKCGDGAPPPKAAKKLTPQQRADRDHRYNMMRANYQASAPQSDSLTPQQWYNVCRFFPTVAARCARPLADVGPHNPYDATASQGPLLGVFGHRRVRPGIDNAVPMPAPREREPGEEG